MDIRELRFRVGEIIGQTLYCSNVNMNGLFRINIDSGDISFAGYFRESPVNTQGMHTSSFLYKDWICFVPKKARVIDFYNWRTKEFYSIPFNDGKGYPVNGILCGNIAWFIPIDAENPVFSLNLDTFSLCNYSSPMSCMEKKQIAGRLFYRVAYLDGKLYAAIYKTSYVFCFDIDTHKMIILDSGVNDLCVTDSGKDGLWLLPEHGNVVCHWKPETGEKIFFQCEIKSMARENERVACFILENENDIYMFPGRMTAEIMKLNKSKGVFEGVFQYPNDLIWRNPDNNYFCGGVLHKRKYYIYPYNANYMGVLDNGALEFVKIKQIEEIEEGKVFKRYLAALTEMGPVNEIQISLKEYLNFIERKSYDEVNVQIKQYGDTANISIWRKDNVNKDIKLGIGGKIWEDIRS